MALLGLSLWLLSAAVVDAEAAATVEARQGQAPVVPGDPPASATISAVTPSLTLQSAGSDGYLRLRYYPRISWVLVQGKGRPKPFVLHNVDLSGLYRSDRGVTWSARASLNTGDTDYSALGQVVGRNQRNITDITGLTYFVAGAGVLVNFVRNWQIETLLEGYHRETTTGGTTAVMNPATPPDPNMPPPLAYPKDTGVTFTPALVNTIDRLNALDLKLGLSYINVSNGRQVLTTGPLVAWRHIMGRNELFRAAAGFVFAKELSPAKADALNPTTVPRTDPFSPIAELAVTRLLNRTRNLVLTTTVLSTVSYYFDPINSTSGPLGAVGWQLSAVMAPRTSASLEAYFATSLRSKPLESNPDETVISATLPIRYRLSRHWTFELGGRYSDRAPHLDYKPFRFHQRELWIYGAITATVATGHATN